ncbi:hypothetical protein INS49_000594 [Diaporthe citri]|uniref:uncharacterized protein n=1 Tax=Diaporthe citri TaxID=83186 RepID=UPI001C804796|nr:uncharacterized protein INS49_000594 [Diaporthe citri]KAG6366417.1 hypothetical protein INS49_000594 [Diaporthe citri]
MPGVAPEIKLVASNTHGHGLDTFSRALSTRLAASAPPASSEDEPAEAVHADAFPRAPSIYKGAQCFVIPSDLLEPREHPLSLRPQKTLDLPETTNVFAPAPYFALESPDTHHVLVACRDHPIQIFRTLPATLNPGDEPQESHHQPHENSSLFSYRLISPQTEAYLPVHSLVWPSPYAAPSSSFFVGSNNLIAQFNLHRIGQGPQQVVHTIPSKRHISKGNGVGMRGTVSALSMQNDENYVPTGLLAAGTWTRWVGLYDFARGGERVATWSVADAAASAAVPDPSPDSPQQPCVPIQRLTSGGKRRPIAGIGGAGINQTAWSPDGRYLLVNERQSTGVLIYDVRVTSKVLGVLADRDALTHQRLDLTVYPDSEGVGGFEVWAGTRDGTVKVWQGVGNDEGCIWPSWDFSTRGRSDAEEKPVRSPVGSVSLHKYGSVIATCTGGWRVTGEDDDGDEVSSSAHSSSSSSSSGSASDDESGSSSSSSSPSELNRHAGGLSGNRTFDKSDLKIWSIRVKPPDGASPEAMATSDTETTQADVHLDMSHRDVPQMDPSSVDTIPTTVKNSENRATHTGD